MVTEQGVCRKYFDTTSKGGGMDSLMEHSEEITLGYVCKGQGILRARAGSNIYGRLGLGQAPMLCCYSGSATHHKECGCDWKHIYGFQL